MATLRCHELTLPNIEAVIFDKDGTLAHAEDYLRHLGQRRARLIDARIPGIQAPLLLAFGLENHCLAPAGLLAVGTRYENEIAAAAYIAETGRGWVESMAIARSAFQEADNSLPRKAEQTPLFEGARLLLQGLTEAGIKIAILSSDSTDNVKDFVQTYGLEPYVQLSLGVDQRPGKPDPGLLYLTCDRLHVSPTTTLMVGDSQADIDMAHAAGIPCVGVTWGWSSPLSLQQADECITSFNQFQVA